MEQIKPRYEFRVWAENLSAAREQLQRLGGSPSVTESEEMYLVSAATDKCNAKIRAALMDIKVLVAVERGLEQWKPVMKGSFPLDSSAIAAQLFPSLELTRPPLAKSAYGLEEFLEEVVRPHPAITIADVRKTRYQFKIGNCATEYAQIVISGVPRDTVAVESVDADAVVKLVQQLGIDGANTSYIHEIKQVMGLAKMHA